METTHGKENYDHGNYPLPNQHRNAQLFEHAYQEGEIILRNSKHCLGYRLLRGIEEPENWILILEWDSVEGHEQGFRKESALLDFLKLVKPFLQQIQEMKHSDNRPMNWRRGA